MLPVSFSSRSEGSTILQVTSPNCPVLHAAFDPFELPCAHHAAAEDCLRLSANSTALASKALTENSLLARSKALAASTAACGLRGDMRLRWEAVLFGKLRPLQSLPPLLDREAVRCGAVAKNVEKSQSWCRALA